MLKLPIQEEHVSVRRTYLLLMKALLDLLAEMPFEKISLTDICRVSMVSRSTFYRYFEDKYDLLHYCIKMYIEGLRPVEDLLYFRNMNSLRIFLTFLLSQAQENLAQYQKIYQVNKNGSLMFLIQHDLAEILAESGWHGESKGYRLKIAMPLYVSFMSSFYLTTLKSWSWPMTTRSLIMWKMCAGLSRGISGRQRKTRHDKMPPVTVFYQVNRRHSFYILYILFSLLCVFIPHRNIDPRNFRGKRGSVILFKVFPRPKHIFESDIL